MPERNLCTKGNNSVPLSKNKRMELLKKEYAMRARTADFELTVFPCTSPCGEFFFFFTFIQSERYLFKQTLVVANWPFIYVLFKNNICINIYNDL